MFIKLNGIGKCFCINTGLPPGAFSESYVGIVYNIIWNFSIFTNSLLWDKFIALSTATLTDS